MSCGGGNRFQCGITRFQKHSFTPDKPSNVELHNENQKRLSDLLKAREEIDKQFFTSNPNTNTKNTNISVSNNTVSNIIIEPLQNTTITLTENNTTYTPWSTPSAEYYQVNTK